MFGPTMFGPAMFGPGGFMGSIPSERGVERADFFMESTT
jgi:hypothetical protein